MKRSLVPIGFVLILLGVVFVLMQIGIMLLTYLWPFSLLAGGWLIHRWYYRGLLHPLALIPGALMLLSSLPLLYGQWFGWESLTYLWPLFVFGLAIGIYEYYVYSKTNDRLLFLLAIALGILSTIALSVTLFIKLSYVFLAALLIVIGVFLIRRTS